MARVEEFNREEVIGKAVAVFWDKGYHGASMQDLVDATGLNRSSLYNSFGSKLELYKTVLDHYQQENTRFFHKVLLKANNPLEAIRGLYEALIPEIEKDKEGKGCLIQKCKTEMGNQQEDIRLWLEKNQESSLSLFRELVEDGQAQGLINKDQDPTAYAYYLMSAFQGFRMTGILVNDRWQLTKIIDNTLKTII